MPHFECGAFNHSATSPGAKSGPSPRGRGRVIGEDGGPYKARGEEIRVLMAPRGWPQTWGFPPRRWWHKKVGPPYASTHWRSRAACNAAGRSWLRLGGVMRRSHASSGEKSGNARLFLTSPVKV